MGSADFGIPALSALISEKYTIAGIVTTPARQKGRGLKTAESPIADYAIRHGLTPLFKPETLSDETFINDLSQLRADLFIVIAYRILPEKVFMIPRIATVNLHASLLPQYRGPAPIHRAIEAGETETGVTVFRIDKGVDTGNIILQKKTMIGERETTPQLYERLSSLGAEAIVETCRRFEQGTVSYTGQDDTAVSYAPKLSKREAAIQWNTPAPVLCNRIRAFKPFPGTYTLLGDTRLGIEDAVPVDGSSALAPGTVCSVTPEWFEVQCQNSCLRILAVKPAGKKRMPVKAYLLGTAIEKGTILG